MMDPTVLPASSENPASSPTARQRRERTYSEVLSKSFDFSVVEEPLAAVREGEPLPNNTPASSAQRAQNQPAGLLAQSAHEFPLLLQPARAQNVLDNLYYHAVVAEKRFKHRNSTTLDSRMFTFALQQYANFYRKAARHLLHLEAARLQESRAGFLQYFSFSQAVDPSFQAAASEISSYLGLLTVSPSLRTDYSRIGPTVDSLYRGLLPKPSQLEDFGAGYSPEQSSKNRALDFLP